MLTRATGAVAGLVCGLVAAGALVPAPAWAAAGEDRLDAGETLTSGQALVSPDGSQTLVLRPDGQLALYGADGGDPRWVSDAGRAGNRLVVTRDGDVRLVTRSGKVDWHTATRGHAGAGLVLRDDGDLVVVDRDGTLVWDAGTAVTPSILNAGGVLGPGKSLASPDGRQTLVVGEDGTLTLRGPDGDVRWTAPAVDPAVDASGGAGTGRASGTVAPGAGTAGTVAPGGTAGATPGGGTAGAPAAAFAVAGSSLVLHDDGNLVLTAPDGSRLWRSRTAGHPGASLTLQADGDLVLYAADGTSLWSTGTQLGPSVLVAGGAVPAGDGLASPDGHLRLRASKTALTLTFDDQPVWRVPVDLPAGGALVLTEDGLALVGPDGTAVWSVGAGAGRGAELGLDEGAALLRTAAGVELWRQDVPADLLEAAQAAAAAATTTQVTADCAQVAGPVPEVDTVATVLGARVHRCLVDAVDAMAAAAAAAGVHLGSASGWRSSAQQAALRRAHCAAVGPDDTVVCEPATAPVGASMHERGLALDLVQDGRLVRSGSTGYAWLTAHAAEYGLANLPGEPWHWSTNGH